MKALEEHKLFEGCSSEFLEVMLREAKRRHIAPGEVLRLADCGSLFLIESGAVRFEARASPEASFDVRWARTSSPCRAWAPL